ARRSIVTVEEVVDQLAPRPGAVVIPSWVLTAVAEAPGGAHPSYAHGYYDRDNRFYTAWDAISRDRERFTAWMQRHVLDTAYVGGTIGAKPRHLPLSIGDGELAETADLVVSVPEIFNYWLQGGRIDVGFLGASQLDRYANLNSTVIGEYEHPKVRLPGGGGAP